MAYDGKLMRRAIARYEEAKTRREEQYAQREQEVYAKVPRIAEINQKLRASVAQVVAATLRAGEDPRAAVETLREENLRLQLERASLLRVNGYPEDYLMHRAICDRCNGSGWLTEGICSCLRSFYTEVQNEELSQMLDLGTQSFETFDLTLYTAEDNGMGKSSRDVMRYNYDYCRKYAHTFSKDSGNILLSGDPGLGKTFLSACIARVVSERGHSVVYDTAAQIFSCFEDTKFHRTDEDDMGTERVLHCDLLIIDDLGTEMVTAFTKSALYEIINTRLQNGRSTIINTNLSPNELGRNYGAAIQSRLEGLYEILPFFGEDIRKIKRWQTKVQ